MAMVIGNEAATSGMTKELYDNIITELGSLPSGFDPTIMKKMMYAISKTIINHLTTNMEVGGVSSSVIVPSTPITVSGSQIGTVHPV